MTKSNQEEGYQPIEELKKGYQPDSDSNGTNDQNDDQSIENNDNIPNTPPEKP